MKYTQYPIQKDNGVIFFNKKLHKAEFRANSELIQCKICGRYFKSIGSHLVRKHGTNEEEYKEGFHIPFTQGLVSVETKEKLSVMSSNWHKRMNSEERQRFLEIVRAAPKGKNCGHRNPGSIFSNARKHWRAKMRRQRLENKGQILSEIRRRYELNPRRLRKTDFSKKEYSKIFWLFGSFKLAFKEAGIPEYPDTREWLKKPKEEVEQRKRNYQRKWILNNLEKNRAYGRKYYWKHIERNRARGRKRYHEKTKFEAPKKPCPTCGKSIRAESPRCRSCTMRIRSNRLRVAKL